MKRSHLKKGKKEKSQIGRIYFQQLESTKDKYQESLRIPSDERQTTH